MTRQEWRGRLNLTGDPQIDRANREAMLDKMAEMLGAAPRPAAEEDRSPIRVGEAIVGEPIRAIGPAMVCGARTVFWPDAEAIDATCDLPPGHVPSNVHRDGMLGEWDEDELITTQGEEQ